VLFHKIASEYILFEKYIYILALEMACPGNQHSANCIGTLLFLIDLLDYVVIILRASNGEICVAAALSRPLHVLPCNSRMQACE